MTVTKCFFSCICNTDVITFDLKKALTSTWPAQSLRILPIFDTKLIGTVWEGILYIFRHLIARSTWMQALATRHVWVTSSLVSWLPLRVNAGMIRLTLHSSGRSRTVKPWSPITSSPACKKCWVLCYVSVCAFCWPGLAKCVLFS